jgi:DNA-binding protein Alba
VTAKNSNRINVSKSRTIEDYVLDAIVLFNQGYETVVIRGTGNEISKAVDVFNSLKSRLGEGVTIDSVEIGSDLKSKRRISYIDIKVKRVY